MTCADRTGVGETDRRTLEIRDFELPVACFAHDLLVGCPKFCEIQVFNGFDRWHEKLAGAIALLHVDGEPEINVLGLQLHWLTIDNLISGIHFRHGLKRLHDGVAHEVGVGDFATASAG